MNLTLEITAVTLNVIYLLLLIKEKIFCWFFGIAGATVSVFLFYSIGLYSEAILYIYYIIIGVYGYTLWNKKRKNRLEVKKINTKQHVILIFFGVLCAIALGFTFNTFTDAVNPFFDSFTTVFSFIASYLEAKKIISSWFFWIIINLLTIVLYLREDLTLYVLLTFVFVIFSVIGYVEWSKKMKETVKAKIVNVG